MRGAHDQDEKSERPASLWRSSGRDPQWVPHNEQSCRGRRPVVGILLVAEVFADEAQDDENSTLDKFVRNRNDCMQPQMNVK